MVNSEESSLVLIAPDIPFSREDAFYPLKRSANGNIVPVYRWRACVKTFIVCLKWEQKKVEFHDLEWFMANGFGLYKRRKPSL